MKTVTLQAEPRVQGKAKNLRKEDKIPAVIYGHELKENQHISLDYQSFRRVFAKAGMSTIIDIKIGDKEIAVLVQDFDVDPVKNTYSHIDFKAVVMGEELTAHIPLKLVGESEAVKTLHGILVYNKESVEVRCLPRNLVHDIEVDISTLVDFHSMITVADLKIPSTITILDNPEVVVASISAPRSEKAEEAEVATAVEATEEAKEEGEGKKDE